MKNGDIVRRFEFEFAQFVGAKYAIALCNGTATLHTALVALGVKPGDRVATTPLTMSATSIAILQAGAVPEYIDVDPKTWLFKMNEARQYGQRVTRVLLPVSLYGLHHTHADKLTIDDAAQTLRKHGPHAFTSYSFQASKILSLGEGGMLVTDSEEPATKAREFSSLGYRMKADQPRIDPSVLKSPSYERHHSFPAFNYRMNDVTAQRGLDALAPTFGGPEKLLRDRREAASLYRRAVEGQSWITPQFVPEGWVHDYWTFAIALESKELWKPFTEAIVRHGGEAPFGAWRLTYHEPAFRHLDPNHRTTDDGETWHNGHACPVAESLQPRLCQFPTNDLASAEKNAKAVGKAIEELNWRKLQGGLNAVGTPLRGLMSEYVRGGPHIPDTTPFTHDVDFEFRRNRGDATGTPCS